SECRNRLFGIVNGVDYKVWNPGSDPYLAQNYDVETVVQGKAQCKAKLQERLQLQARSQAPLFGLIARLVEQKGIELVIKAEEVLLAQDAQLAILGEGDPIYHRQLTNLRDRFPGRIGLTLGFDEGLAHQIEAGADLFLMPSLYEPSGLNQLYSMKYGT